MHSSLWRCPTSTPPIVCALWLKHAVATRAGTHILQHKSGADQLWSQTKTHFTAFFFVKLLGERLWLRQWAALGLLTLGVGLVQLEEAGCAAAPSTAAIRAASGTTSARAIQPGSPVVGVAAVLASSLLSGFANIWFEKVIKEAECKFDDSCDVDDAAQEPVSLWLRNVQLAIFSIPQAALLLFASRRSRAVIAEHGVLVGFTPLVWLATALTAFGGLLIAAVVKYADNVLKTFATAVAIVLTCAAQVVSTRTAPSAGFLQGMALVLLSMLLYNGVIGGSRSKHSATRASSARSSDG
jgi:UDP-sugar transporter A1/2/3